jgi:hypothetical protein
MRNQRILLALSLVAALTLSLSMLAFGLTDVAAAAKAGNGLLALSGVIQVGIGVYVGSTLVRATRVGLRTYWATGGRRPDVPLREESRRLVKPGCDL